MQCETLLRSSVPSVHQDAGADEVIHELSGVSDGVAREFDR